jgi:hypothetical protein
MRHQRQLGRQLLLFVLRRLLRRSSFASVTNLRPLRRRHRACCLCCHRRAVGDTAAVPVAMSYLRSANAYFILAPLLLVY